MVLFSHPTGNANVRHAALGLHRAGLLEEYWTTLNYRLPSTLARLLPAGARKQMERRAYPSDLRSRLHSHPWREASRLLCGRVGLGHLSRHEVGWCSVDGVYQSLDRRVARRIAADPSVFRAVYAYEDGAAFTFREARQRGISTFYDQPIGYWRAARRILEEEAQRQPEWAMTLKGNRDSAAKVARKDEELAAADVVFVASTFTQRTLAEAPGSPSAIVIPYGAPERVNAAPQSRPSRERLRVLFVGSLGQRKGLSYLFDAVRQTAGAAELTVIGRRPDVGCPALDRELQRVRYLPSCTHAEVLREMAAHDAFVFPSLFEGFGLVLLEAMAMGLPILATDHTAAPDLITSGVEGHIVPIRDAAAMARHLTAWRDDPDACRGMGERARARAQTFTWARYEQELAAQVARALESSTSARV